MLGGEMRASLERAGERLCDGVVLLLVLLMAALPWLAGAALVLGWIAAVAGVALGIVDGLRRLVEWMF